MGLKLTVLKIWRLKYLAFISLLSFCFCLDMDIDIPPGTPTEIISNFQPSVTITTDMKLIETQSGTPTQPNDGEKVERRGTEVKKQIVLPPKAPPPVSAGFFEATGITTIDFPGHYPWASTLKSGLDPIAEDLAISGYTQEEKIKSWKPKLIPYSDPKNAKYEAYLKCFQRILIRYFHLNRTLENEDIFYFMLFGDPPASFAASINEVKKDLKEYCGKIMSYLDPETKQPVIPGMPDDYSLMMYTIVLSELVYYYPFTVNSPFAPGLDHFASEEIYPHLRSMLKSTNKRVMRNAVYYLGTMQKYDALAELFNILQNSSDKVARARSLYFLTASSYPELASYLISQLDSEKDPVFEVAFLNALGKLGDKKAFPGLCKKIISMASAYDYEKLIAAVKACARCVDKRDKETLKQLAQQILKIHSSLEGAAWAGEPETPDLAVPADSYRGDARRKTLKEVLEISLAACGEKQALGDLPSKFEEIINRLETPKKRAVNAGAVGGSPPMALGSFDVLNRLFLVEVLPEMGKTGKILLERLLLSGFEHDNVLFTALNTYYRYYPDDFEKLALQILILNKELPVPLVDKALKYMYFTDLKDDKTKKNLDKILNMLVMEYGPQQDLSSKHLSTLAVFYLGLGKKLKEKILSSIIDSELREQKPEPVTKEQDPPLLGLKIEPTSSLIRICIEMLGRMKTVDAEKALLKLAKKITDIENKRILAKALGNFTSKEVKAELIEMLSDKDSWTRLIAYLSLSRITRKEHKIDWFYTDLDKLKPEIEKYKTVLN
ncbi:MAG: HEAT repeat domain-containing protein [Planctomycetes bacterium]|nr:HEAT repeat domain-containing protein [Planctomycetota bacterium]